MKKLNYQIFLLTLLCIFLMPVNALELVVITGNEVRLRTEPNTSQSSKTITYLYSGDELTLIKKDVSSGNGCPSTWHKVKYNETEGYICGTWATIKIIEEKPVIKPEDYQEYSEYLKEIGFPNTYIPHLIQLHQAHPNWQFSIMNLDLDFNNFVGMEYKSNGLSLIEDTGNYIDGYKSFDSWSYNYLTNIFYNGFHGGGKNWYAASKQTISYYIDPRNFLNERQIFMFENLTYNKTYHTKQGVEAMLKGTFMETGYSDTENRKTYIDAFIDAASKYNVSPYLLVSRVIQEIGPKGSTITSGTVVGYEGYYNFYNIEAHGKNSEETIRKGLEKAKTEGWNNQYKAIVGGAKFLTDEYISAGQDTLYLQKWDIFGPNYTNHQYMQNIQAPANESIKTYNGYKNISQLDNTFIFTIPVYKNMPNKTTLPNSGNPNNYLSSLAVNGGYLFQKPSTQTSFNLNLDTNTSSIEISATKVYSGSTISGTGSISLKGEKQTVPIKVTAQNGDIRTYNINITRTKNEALSISEILRILEIKNDGTYIYGLELGTDISKVRKNIIDKEPTSVVTTKNKNDEIKTTGIIASGDKIIIKTSKEEKKYSIIIYGDVNSDGKISASDYMTIKNHIMDIKKLTESELIYADANKDGKVTASDYMTIKNHIMDVKKITQ